MRARDEVEEDEHCKYAAGPSEEDFVFLYRYRGKMTVGGRWGGVSPLDV